MSSALLAKIEANHLWPDFHAKFLNYWQESLAESLPPQYEARIGEQVSLYCDNGATRRFSPDVSVVRSPVTDYSVETGVEQITTAVLDHVPIAEEVRTTHIEIVHRPNRQLVTWLELLSPSNKEEPGRSRYLAKRMELLQQPIHLIELDLLLGGQRLPHRQQLPTADYFAFTSRVEERFRCAVTGWKQTARLPTITIPLLVSDPAIKSLLQTIIETVYSKGQYERACSNAV